MNFAASRPTENSHTSALEPGSHMTPEEHYRRMMSALNEHGSFEEQQQRLYQLANNMGVPSHGECASPMYMCVCELVSVSALITHVVLFLDTTQTARARLRRLLTILFAVSAHPTVGCQSG